MIAFKDFYIVFAKTDFNCPHCEKLHKDKNDKYFNRINKSKTWKVKIKLRLRQTVLFNGQL